MDNKGRVTRIRCCPAHFKLILYLSILAGQHQTLTPRRFRFTKRIPSSVLTIPKLADITASPGPCYCLPSYCITNHDQSKHARGSRIVVWFVMVVFIPKLVRAFRMTSVTATPVDPIDDAKRVASISQLVRTDDTTEGSVTGAARR
jgi:hypothetical protein